MSASLEWTRESEFVIDDVTYVCSALPVGPKSASSRFRLIKARWSVERYERLLREFAPKFVVELGIYDGGSTAFIAQFARPERLVAIELEAEPCHALETFLDESGLRSSVTTCYGVDQADTSAVEDIVARHFHNPLDLVIGDASHLVDQTRASFELLFPKLRPGGLYLIEDWSWAHNKIPPQGERRKLVPLSALVFELMLTCAHRPDLIEEIVLRKGWALIRRGAGTVDPAFALSQTYGEVGRQQLSNLTRPWDAGDIAATPF